MPELPEVEAYRRFFVDHAVGARVEEIIVPDAAILRNSRSEEHTSELQSRQYLVCRLLLEENKNDGRIPLAPTDVRRDALHTLSSPQARDIRTAPPASGLPALQYVVHRSLVGDRTGPSRAI